MKTVYWIGLVAILGAGCATGEPFAESRQAREATQAIQVTESKATPDPAQFQDLGLVECSHTRYEKGCLDELKLEGVQVGANLLNIVSKRRWSCEYGPDNCQTIIARAYRLRAS